MATTTTLVLWPGGRNTRKTVLKRTHKHYSQERIPGEIQKRKQQRGSLWQKRGEDHPWGLVSIWWGTQHSLQLGRTLGHSNITNWAGPEVGFSVTLTVPPLCHQAAEVGESE